jgi:hypothetical protein
VLERPEPKLALDTLVIRVRRWVLRHPRLPLRL